MQVECTFSKENDMMQVRVGRTLILVLKVCWIGTQSLALNIRGHTVKTFCSFVPGTWKANGCFSKSLQSSLFH